MTDFIWGMRDARTAALAGQDVEMPFRNHFDRHLRELVEAGEVPESRVDDAALRVLRQLVRFGQGRDPAAYTRRRRWRRPSTARSPARRRARGSSC